MASNYQREILFTDKGTVIYSTPRGVFEKPASKFLREVEKKYKKDGYGVFFDKDNNKFTMNFNGIDYDVKLTKESEESLQPTNGEPNYTPLVLKLLYMSMIEEQYNNYLNAIAVRKAKIKEINDSFYETMETLEDHEIYLDYLDEEYKKAKTKEQRDVINTKVAYLAPIVQELRAKEKQKRDNPLNLKYHINRFVIELLEKAKQLDDAKRLKIANLLKKIVQEYQRIVNEYNRRSKNTIVLGNPLLSLEILGKIVDVEFLLAGYLKEKQASDYIDSRMGSIVEQLNQDITSKGKGGM